MYKVGRILLSIKHETSILKVGSNQSLVLRQSVYHRITWAMLDQIHTLAKTVDAKSVDLQKHQPHFLEGLKQ